MYSNSDERKFEGVWIQKEIWLNKDLSLIDKVLFVEIKSLDNTNHCTKSNAHFAEFFNCSERTITRSVAKLKELGYIGELPFNGKFRRLYVEDKWMDKMSDSIAHRQNVYTPSPNCLPSNIDSNTEIDNNSNKLELLEQPTVTPKTSHNNSSKLPKRIPLIKSDTVRESINNSSNTSKENKKENESILNKGVVSPIKKKNLYEKCMDKIDEFTDDAEIRERLIEYLGVRLERKDIEFGSKGFEGMLKRLKRTSSDKEEQLAIIQQAIDRNYPTFYPLSKYTKQNKDVFSEYGKVKSVHKDEEIVNVSF